MRGKEGTCSGLGLGCAAKLDQCFHCDCLAFLREHARGKNARVLAGKRERTSGAISNCLARGSQQREFVGGWSFRPPLWCLRGNRRAVNRVPLSSARMGDARCFRHGW